MNPSAPAPVGRPFSGLYLILDQDAVTTASPAEAAAAAIAGGVKLIQYRAKNLSKREAYSRSLRLRELAHQNGVTLLINDWADLALAVQADGVHLGQDDLPPSAARAVLGPGRIIGVSAHTPEQAKAAESEGADYLGIGPIFPSRTKQGRPPLGCDSLRRIRAEVRIPIIAIGGITARNLREVTATGVDGVAVVSAVLGRPDITQAAAELISLLKAG
jgi:thiamine-phosphate pyrophosphorylase